MSSGAWTSQATVASTDTTGVSHIPTLDDDGDITGQISKPAPEAPKVYTTEDLDEIAAYSLPPIPFNDIPSTSVAFLTDAIDPAVDVFEDDDVWDAENLLSEISNLFETTT
ncbi:hypothetical protein GEMRC1_005320 [Eukaryota sp. GEM-RC1]